MLVIILSKAQKQHLESLKKMKEQIDLGIMVGRNEETTDRIIQGQQKIISDIFTILEM